MSLKDHKTLQDAVNVLTSSGILEEPCSSSCPGQVFCSSKITGYPACVLIVVDRFDSTTKRRVSLKATYSDVIYLGRESYGLAGVLCHKGLLARIGHNTVVANHSTFDGGKWIEYNDCQVCYIFFLEISRCFQIKCN